MILCEAHLCPRGAAAASRGSQSVMQKNLTGRSNRHHQINDAKLKALKLADPGTLAMSSQICLKMLKTNDWKVLSAESGLS